MTTITTQAPPTEFSYSRWRHGGWYVHDVRYPNGSIGCISRNYPDKKWRIVCDLRDSSSNGAAGEHTYPSRDAAAQAEWELARKASVCDVCEANIWPDGQGGWRGIYSSKCDGGHTPRRDPDGFALIESDRYGHLFMAVCRGCLWSPAGYVQRDSALRDAAGHVCTGETPHGQTDGRTAMNRAALAQYDARQAERDG